MGRRKNLARIGCSFWLHCGLVAACLSTASAISALAQTGTPGFPSQNRGGGAPILPQIELAPPAPPAAVPPTPSPLGSQLPAAKPELRGISNFTLRSVHIVGNTVLDKASIDAIVAPYLGKSVTLNDLEEIRQRFTRLYIDRGFVNSGAVIPDQDVANGVVTFQFVEGRVTDIKVTGTDHFNPDYFSSRLARGTQAPFNIA